MRSAKKAHEKSSHKIFVWTKDTWTCDNGSTCHIKNNRDGIVVKVSNVGIGVKLGIRNFIVLNIKERVLLETETEKGKKIRQRQREILR